MLSLPISRWAFSSAFMFMMLKSIGGTSFCHELFRIMTVKKALTFTSYNASDRDRFLGGGNGMGDGMTLLRSLGWGKEVAASRGL